MDGLNFIYSGSPENQEAHLLNGGLTNSCWEEMKMGKLYAKTARYDEAIKHYNQAIKMHSTEMSFYFYRGIARFHLNDLHGAKADLYKAKSVNPWNLIDVLNYLSCIQFRLGNYKSARESVARVLNANRGLLNDLVMSHTEYLQLSSK